MFNLSKSINPGQNIFGKTVPEPPKGNVILQIIKQADIVQKIDENTTRFISIMCNDPQMKVPSVFLGFIMKNVCMGRLKNVVKKAGTVHESPLYKAAMSNPERAKYY